MQRAAIRRHLGWCILGATMAVSCRVLLLILLPFVWVDPALFAQIGGPFPGGGYPPGGYPPGGYPPGRYPGGGYPGGGGVGIPMPGGRSKKKTSKDDAQPTQSVTGMLRSLNDTQLVLEADDTRLITLKRTTKTKFLKDGDPMKPADLNPGDHLDIDATQDDEGYFTAVNVNFNKAGSSADRAKASQPVEASTRASSGGSVDGDDDRPRIKRADASAPAADADAPAAAASPQSASPAREPRSAPAPDVASDKPLPPAKPDPDDPGPPTVRRGKPTRQASTASRSSDEPVQIASAQTQQTTAAVNPTLQADPDGAVPARPTITLREGQQQRSPDLPPVDPIILMAMEAAESFSETLPNYVCQQFTARFVSVTHVVSWQAQDVVSAEVVYENGREDYRNLKINDKPIKKGMEELSGAWSTGEFGTLLRDIFSPATAAEFHFRKDTAISGKSAALYDFKVAREGSHWHVMVASQSVFPPYKGSIWIDKHNGRVLRIEMQARNMPGEFPLDTVESEADYQYVRIGGTQEFLLPVHAETLSCQRGTNNCSRNSIDFRNYKKYSGEANITFEK